jgi:DUF4097 and DUF4098 domain-containing protein YvlB
MLTSPRLQTILPLVAVLTLNASAALAQSVDEDWLERCRDSDRWGRSRAVHCEVRETRLPATGRMITVDGRENGGVDIEGWDRNEILVRARVQAHADSDQEARELAGRVNIETAGANIRAEGPSSRRSDSWSVSYQIMVPRNSDLTVRTNNGPIAVEDVSGAMELRATNGPLVLRKVGGDVRGRTTNGPLRVELEGDRWNGSGLNVETTNGPVVLTLPANYSARLETGTVNGPINTELPITVQGRLNKQISADLGGGGPTIRATTTNGPVTIRRR